MILINLDSGNVNIDQLKSQIRNIVKIKVNFQLTRINRKLHKELNELINHTKQKLDKNWQD